MTTTAKERRLLIPQEMIPAVLDGRKTQHRVPIKPQPREVAPHDGLGILKKWVWDKDNSQLKPGDPLEWLLRNKCPYGFPGERVWIPETWQQVLPLKNDQWVTAKRVGPWENARIVYAAGCDEEPPSWRPSTQMPRWAARIVRELTDVRVEQVQDMTFEDVIADFCPDRVFQESFRASFVGWDNQKAWCKEFWDSRHAKDGYGWDANPPVWVLEWK